MIAVRNGVECKLCSRGGASDDEMAEIPSYLGYYAVGGQVRLVVSYSSYTEEYDFSGTALCAKEETLPSPVLLAHQSEHCACLVTNDSVRVVAPSPFLHALSAPIQLAAADGQFIACASRNHIHVLRVESDRVETAGEAGLEFDASCVCVKALAGGCLVVVGEWVTNTLHFFTVTGAGMAQCASMALESTVTSCVVVEVASEESRPRFLVASRNDGVLQILRQDGAQWLEEKRFRGSALPGRCVRRSAEPVLCVGEKSWLLEFKNHTWL